MFVLRQRQKKGISNGWDYWTAVLRCMAHARLYMLCAGAVGIFDCWCTCVSHRDLARLLSLVYVSRYGRGHEIGVADVARAGDGQ